MKLKDAARAALSGMPSAVAELGVALLEDQREGAFSARFNDGGQIHTVVWEYGIDGSRVACTCGGVECQHQSALFTALVGSDEDRSRVPPQMPPRTDSAQDPQLSEGEGFALPDHQDILQAMDELIRQTCANGLKQPAQLRDEALEKALRVLSGQDMPDLKRTVATLRRALTASPPDPRSALTAVARLATLRDELKEVSSAVRTTSRNGMGLELQATRKEEVRLFEIARRTQRTPFGERRDVSFFLDLDEKEVYREVGAVAVGSAEHSLSDGPFPKRLLGNLVAIEDGPSPKRIRLLQFASVGFSTGADIDRMLACCQTEVLSLYETFRLQNDTGLMSADPLALFAPDHVNSTPTGIVLCDESGAILPLARRFEPTLCETVDLLAHRGTLLAVIGQLVLAQDFLTLLPLTALVELEGQRSLRRLT